jgi:hypothetical protein
MKDVAVVAYCRTGIAKAVRGAHKAVIGVCSAGGMATAAYLER